MKLNCRLWSLAFLVAFIFVLILFSNFSKDFIKFPEKERGKGEKDWNVILVSLDTLRADHLGCYGYFRNTSPNIDAFAKESVLFKHSYSASFYTLPSHMSIFTSLYPSSHGINFPYGSFPRLDKNVKTLAQILKANNYTTAWVAPLDTPYLDLKRGFERGFEYFIESEGIKNGQSYFWEDGLKWIRENKKEKFFIFLHSYRVHVPYIPLMDNILKFSPAISKRMTFNSESQLSDIATDKIISKPSRVFKRDVILKNKQIYDNKSLLRELLPNLCKNYSNLHTSCSRIRKATFWENVDVYNSDDMDYMQVLYDAEILEADQDVQRLIELLKSENLMNKTVLVITSDHGEEFMDHGNIVHGPTLYDEKIHVPLIMWIPGIEGKEVSSLVQGIDIMPTILDLLGINIPGQAQGVSLLPLIRGNVESLKEYIYSETIGNILAGNTLAIRSVDWKYISNFKDVEELYNLETDPFEKNNVIALEPGIAKHLKNKLKEHVGVIADVDEYWKKGRTWIRKGAENLSRYINSFGNKFDADFTVKVNGENYNVIVGKPKSLAEYPLVIYHHGGYQDLNTFELRELSRIFAREGFLFWAPERSPWNPARIPPVKEAQAIDAKMLDTAIKHPEVDKKNINVVGFGLGSWVAFENDAMSSHVKSVVLLSFGRPYDTLSGYVGRLVNNTDYSKISAKLLIMVSEEDLMVDIEAGETVRERMARSNKTVDCVKYLTGGHFNLAGAKHYTKDLIRYLKGVKIDTADSIKVDEDLKRKLKNIRETGYW